MLSKLSIASKISLGFMVNLLLLAGLAIFAVWKVGAMGEAFSEYRQTARQTLAFGQYTQDVSGARLASMRYRLSPDESAVAAVHSEVDSILAQAEAAETVFATNTALLQRLVELKKMAAAYRSDFDRMVALQGERNEHVAAMSEAGREARVRLWSIMQSANRDGDAAAAVAAGNTLQHLLLGRLYGERFLLNNDPAAYERAKAELETMMGVFRQLNAELQNAERRRLAAEGSTLARRYSEAMSEAHATITARNKIRAERLDVLGPTIQTELEALTHEVVARQNTLGPAAQQDMEAARTVVIAVSAIAALVAALLAFLLPRTLGGLRRLQDAVAAIARAEDNVVIPGRERKDEVGGMARALETISQTGAQSARVTAAVAASQSAVLVLDAKRRSVYANQAFEALAEKQSAVFALLAPIESGRRNAARLCEMIEEARASRETNPGGGWDISYSGAVFSSSLSAVTDANGAEIGATVELTDVTEVRKLEQDVVSVIEEVERGEFSRRVDQIDDLGFTSFVARGLNRLMEAVSTFMAELGQSLDAMSRGDLTCAIEAEMQGDFERAKENLNANLVRFREAIGEISSAVRTVDSASEEISDSSGRSAEGAESQAASLQETAATMEEMASTIRSAASNSGAAASLATEASGQAAKGREIVAEAVGAMSTIKEGSNQISEIISVIDAISFQTNLLALNAAVEAARAGEAGKGFAVVAAEVRGLAERSSKSADEIKALIHQSSEQVAQGVERVNQAGVALDGIAEMVGKLSEMIEGISNSSKEQAAGVEEINATIANLDKLTQQNAAIAEQSASSARGLAGEPRKLSSLANSFKTDASGGEDGAMSQAI